MVVVEGNASGGRRRGGKEGGTRLSISSDRGNSIARHFICRSFTAACLPHGHGLLFFFLRVRNILSTPFAIHVSAI